jgi:hypothetical protein
MSDPVSAIEFVKVDNGMTTGEMLSNSQIVESVQVDEGDEPNDSEEMRQEEFGIGPTIVDARAALSVLKTYCFTNEEDVNCLSDAFSLGPESSG